jgi:hypothetical protein
MAKRYGFKPLEEKFNRILEEFSGGPEQTG